MTISADLGLVAAAGDGLVEQWRDLGPTLWLVTGVMAALWLAVLGVLAAMHDPRKVRPGPAVLELQGSEHPAVVNLLTTDWDLGHEAIPATLVDLAAKRHVDIDMVGDDTFVTVRKRGPATSAPLTTYESMVLRHVGNLASHTPEGRVPAAALTTGPEQSAKHWWKRFQASVVHDARDRGLSRPRWPAGVKTVMILLALPIAFTAALAGSTLPDDPENPDDDPVEGAIACGIGTLIAAAALVGTRSGERDTSEGREAAARWLGLRELLAEDPLFAEQPPAAVAIWDHLLAHGTALGVAHGVVQALPLGAESEREAWSSVGGRWRVVRVRYPRLIPPGYGRHPGLAVLIGLLLVVIGLPLVQLITVGLQDLVDVARQGGTTDFGAEVPRGAGTPLAIGGAVITIMLGMIAVIGAWMVLAGIADLVMGRTTIEGRVLRIRDRVKDDKVTRHVAVDDGTSDRVRAWRFRKYTFGDRGDTVRGRVTRFLRHVRDFEVVGQAVASAAEAVAEAERACTRPIGTQAGGAAPFGLGTPAGTSLAAAAMAAVEALTTASSHRAQTGGPGGPGASGGPARGPYAPGPYDPSGGGPGTGGGPDGAGDGGQDHGAPAAPPAAAPALPDDGAVSAAAGMGLARDPSAKPHPAALGGGSALYRTGGDGHVQVAWIPAVAIDVYRRLPTALRHELPGVGDEGYRARFGGGVMARRGDHVVMITPHLPGMDKAQRDDIAVRVAAAALALAPAAAPASPPPRPPQAPIVGAGSGDHDHRG